MPELPEVETVRTGLNQLTLLQPIQGGDVLLPRTVAHPVSSWEFLTALEGTQIQAWSRRGKYLLASLVKAGSDRPAGWLGVHLRMTGQLLWLDREAPLQKHARVRLWLGGDRELRFVDQRTFGRMWWVPPDCAPEQIITGLQGLGPEPFDAAFSVDYLMTQLRLRRGPIKSALLDQGLVAGVGNIYADESLFLSQIHPQTPCAALTRSQVERLREALIGVLQASIAVGGTTFSTFLNVQGVNGNYKGEAWVYGRTAAPCRHCGALIERLKLGGRSTHFCPACQPERSPR
ncbi:DNA-formamidopyrimidine glycosylase [Geitlerinema sp. PCC 7407]|uniref:DNA-formamidopyrimidine glycosylase n=1 Tax=Geitlerinema sp. PCC 7407 TaxID=1173025 RepID=UPI00029FE51A|nr:DNA-formamidopyrimidine glycosylase [Geitlerinema sp. PCC 7407]AFY67849.1 DNA-(apurinic or apyrimidinic site) lyase, Formamidopyrimidine-DNA glycosylase [Geitlerinema sp. PCC 7407]